MTYFIPVQQKKVLDALDLIKIFFVLTILFILYIFYLITFFSSKKYEIKVI